MDQPPVGQGLNRELFERGERAEVEIDCFISRRAAREAQERAEYVRDHQRELFSLLERQHREAGNTVARLAGETLAALLEMYRAEDEARELRRTHPEPAEVNASEAASITTIIHHSTVGNVPGQRRGDIEGVFRLLQSYAQATEVGEVPEEDELMAVMHAPEPGSDARNGREEIGEGGG